MKNRYIHLSDVHDAIINDIEYICTLKGEIEHLNKRIKYLECLENYLSDEGLCPFIKRDLLENDIKLCEFVSPLLARQDVLEFQKKNSYYVKQSFSNLCEKVKNSKYNVKFEFDNNKYVIVRNVDIGSLSDIFEYKRDRVLPKITIEKVVEQNAKL